MSVCSIFFAKKDIPGAGGRRRAILNSPESHNLPVLVREGARTGNQQFGQARPVDERRHHQPDLGHISLWVRIDAARYSRYDLQGDERAGRLMISAEEKKLWLKILAHTCRGSGCDF